MSTTQQQPQPQRKGLYKLTIHARRRPGMSEEDFHHHWTTSHAPKVSSFLRRYGIVGYTQYHTPSWVRAEAEEKLTSLGEWRREGLVDWDGCVELRMPELECWERAREDPYYKEVVAPDEAEFFDFENSRFTVGWEETYVDASKGGEVVEELKGKS